MPNIRSIVGINRHLQDEQVALYVDALKLNKTNRLPDHVRRHVAQCQTCRKNITELYSLLMDEDYSHAGPHPFFDKVESSAPLFGTEYVRIAAVLVALVGLVLVVYYVGTVKKNARVGESNTTAVQSGVDSSSRANKPATQTHPQSSELYADRFEVLPQLEDMVHTEFRSGGLEDVSPKNGEIVKGKPVFNWKGLEGDDVTVTIYNNRGETIYKLNVSALPLVTDRVLPEGLYYWKIQNSAELFHVGKFLVR